MKSCCEAIFLSKNAGNEPKIAKSFCVLFSDQLTAPLCLIYRNG